MTKAYDIIIVGAGIVGQTLAIGLAKKDLRVALIDAANEPKQPVVQNNEQPPIFNARVSAISSASEALLKRLGAWNKIARMQPYKHMHVWDTDGFGDIAFDTNSVPSIGKPKEALGHIIENEIINAALYETLKPYSNVDCYFNASVSDLHTIEDAALVKVALNDDTSFNARAKLLIGADGANSKVRTSFGFTHTFWDYDHHAIVANITAELPHNNTARQAFTPFGPLAFLPLPDAHQSSIVLSQQSNQASKLMALNDNDFEKALQVAINNQYGKVHLNTKRVSFPLRMRYANQWTCKHVAIMGDAAHTIHPLAGQGANLGLADVQTMLDVIAQHKASLGEMGMLRKYERCRKAEAVKVIATMEGFKQLFDGQQPLKKLVRNLGLLGANKLPGVKAFFIAKAMG
ncbi:MAG: 2-octaprenylphenol hydroxylase [Alphaproteobacteria bacterium]|jgi:2-octaprenylphenol hydroxylase